MFALSFYILILLFACGAMKICQSRYVVSGDLPSNRYFSKKHSLLFLFAVSPIIAIYGLRYGIGTDYFSYEKIYDVLHKSNFLEYLTLHAENFNEYYVEFGYFILNKYLSPSYIFLSFLCSVIMLIFIYFGAVNINSKLDIAFVVFIYFCTQFIYSMNGVRFSIAVAIIFFGYQFILKKKLIKWVLIVFLATLFHKTAVICLPFYFLRDIESRKISKLRNSIYFICIILFPFLVNFLIKIISQINLFSRYFQVAKYALGDFIFKPKFLLHIIPVIFPLLFYKPNFLLNDSKISVLFRIYLLEIPLRELGAFNTWLTRLVRYPQMVELLLIPYILYSIKNKKIKILLSVYYFLLYIFYFAYFALVNDFGDSLPYRSVLFK